FGLQVGFDYVFRKCKWNWGFHGKTGPYINFADQISRIVTDAAGDEPAGPDLDVRRVADADDAALLVEVGVEGSYKIRPNMSLRASYDLMWMVGMARAADQLDFDLGNIPQLNNDATMFIHGLSLGVECLW
ncbi:MAG: BBP7 family outer membrane beta-barrel protein, partial [Thermoguttaceae bacterium]